MSPLPALLAAAPSTALPERPSLLETLEFQAVGLVIVLGALTMLYLICTALGAFFRRADARAAERAATASRASAPAARAAEPGAGAAEGEEPPVEAGAGEIPVAVIAAAVAAVVTGPHRLLKVAPASAGWSLEGRRQLLTSHQLRY